MGEAAVGVLTFQSFFWVVLSFSPSSFLFWVVLFGLFLSLLVCGAGCFLLIGVVLPYPSLYT